MLFEFPRPGLRSFWMWNVKVPLDIIFVREDGTVANIEHSAEPGSVKFRKSSGPVSFVVEVAGGSCDKHGIRPGWVLERG